MRGGAVLGIAAAFVAVSFFMSAGRSASSGLFIATFYAADSGITLRLQRVREGPAQLVWAEPTVAAIVSRNTGDLLRVSPTVFHIPESVDGAIDITLPWSEARRLGAHQVNATAVLPTWTFAPAGAIRSPLRSYVRVPSGAVVCEWPRASNYYLAAGIAAGIVSKGEDGPKVVVTAPGGEGLASELADTLRSLSLCIVESTPATPSARSTPTVIAIPEVFHGYAELERDLPCVSNVLVGPYAAHSPALRTQAAALLLWPILETRHPGQTARERAVWSMVVGDLVQARVMHSSSLFGDEWNADLVLNILSKAPLHEKLDNDPGETSEGNETVLQRDALSPVLLARVRSASAQRLDGAIVVDQLLDDLISGGLPRFKDCLVAVEERLSANSAVVPAASAATGQGPFSMEILSEYGGILEDCGCKNMSSSGGLSRLYHDALRRSSEGRVRLALGDMVGRVGEAARARATDSLLLCMLGELSTTALVPGGRELLSLATNELEEGEFRTVPLLACNVRRHSGELLGSPFIDVAVSEGAALRIIGVGGMLPRLTSRREKELISGRFQLEDVAEAVGRAAASAPRGTTVLVAGYVAPADIPRVAERLPRGAIIVSRYRETPRVTTAGRSTIQLDGSCGNARVVFPSAGMYGYDLVRWEAEQGMASCERVVLKGPLPRGTEASRRIQSVLEAIDDHMPIELQWKDPLASIGAKYVGSDTCATCHPEIGADWRQTGHANAMQTLKNAQREGIRNCVACHVVGFETQTGYSRSAPRSALEGVGCEVCHGPGSLHIEDPQEKSSIRRVPGRALCASCHTLMHSDFLLQDPQVFMSRIDHHGVLDGR